MELELRADRVVDCAELDVGLETLAGPLRRQMLYRDRLSNQKMADAVKKISINKGFDPKEYALLGFGGAVGQHICDIADLLGQGAAVPRKAERCAQYLALESGSSIAKDRAVAKE